MKKFTFLFFTMLMFVLSWQGMAQAGSTCDDPLVVTSMPFTDSGNTSAYGNNYSSSDMPPLAPGAITNGTSDSYLGGDDVVYSYTAGSNGLLNVNASGVGSWVGMYVFTGCNPFVSTVGSHTSSSSGTRSIPDIPVLAGETYYIIISTWPTPNSTDYTLTLDGPDVFQPESCTGTPDAGIAVVNPQTGNAGSSYSVSAQGYELSSDMTFQWQSNTNGQMWVDQGAPTSVHTSYTATAPNMVGDEVEWRLALTCTASGITSYSDVATFTTGLVYCTPVYTSTSDYLSSISSVGAISNINYSATSQPAGGYADETNTTLVTYANQEFDLNTTYVGGNNTVNVWIDWNGNGTFEESEKFGPTSGGADQSLVISVPENTNNGDYRMRVRGVYDYSGTTDPGPCSSESYGSAIDFTVNVVDAPSCVSPVELSVGNITSSGADVSWTVVGSETSWNVSWGLPGYTPGVDDLGTDTASTTSYQLAGLTPQTSYDVYVQADCGSSDLSNWAGPLSFTTACGTITEMFEDFDSYDTGSIVPDCWERILPEASAGSQTISSTSPASGSRNIYQYASSSQNSVIVALPLFSNVNAGTHWLRLKARVSSGAPGTLSVGYVTDVSDHSSFVLIEDVSITNTSYTSDGSEYTVGIPTSVPANARLAIKNANDGKSYYWDDVYWEVAPSCLAVSGLDINGWTPSSVDVTWNAVGSEASWNVSWGTPGYTPGDTDEIDTATVTTTSHQITGLSADTNYDIYVQADCGNGDLSTWRGPLAVFTGYCTPVISSTVEPITYVGLGDIDNTTDASSSDEYEDFTAISTEVDAGETYEITLKGNTSGSYTNYFTVFVDWNENGVLDDTNEMYEIGSIYNSTGVDEVSIVGDLLVPADATPGNKRMRIIKNFNSSPTNPCGSYSFGQIEDYTVVVTGEPGDTFPFPYCDITNIAATDVEEITKVEFAGTTIINDDFTSVLVDKTDVIVEVEQNETYTISVEGNTYSTGFDFDNNIVAFIDWNQNGILDDAGEIYEVGNISGSDGNDGVAAIMDITVPADAVLGETRIRITKTYWDEDSDPLINPCAIEFDPWGMGNFPSYGQALDFTLEIVESTGGGDEDCAQGDDSNGFENGLNITAGGTFRNADDFIVSPNNTLNVQSIELNIFADGPITNIDVNFYNDENGAPGATVVESVTGLVPYAQVPIGTEFGYTVYAVYVEVDLEFVGGATGTTYWMQPEAQVATAFWEVTTLGTLGAPIHTSESLGAWVADEDGAHAVFKLHCDVATPPDSECLFDITSTVEPITRVVMNNVDNASSVNSDIALEDFTDIIIMAEAGASYDVAFEGYTGGNFTNYITLFVDISTDQDWSDFEAIEIGTLVNSTGTDGQQATANITIPSNFPEGQYNLRVIKNFGSSPLDPCAAYTWGQGEDYTLMIGELDDCSGTPDAGVASVDPESGNINTTYTVSAVDYSFGNGMTYQWQSNTDGAGWENEGDLLDQYASHTATAPAEYGVSVEWRLEVTCTLSSETSYSETATFTTEMTYCTPMLDCADGDMITNVNFQEIDNTTTCSPDGYGDYTDMVATVQAGGTYPISVSVGDGWSSESVSVWIDFDNNGSFDEDEFFYIGTGSGEALLGDITIPADAANGDYRMRVRVAAVGPDTATWDMACDETQGYGETEDYTVTVDGVVGMDDHSAVTFSYYPNPMGDVLYITSSENVETISAYNVIGQEVLSSKKLVEGKMNVSTLPSGAYMFRVTFENGITENFKVLKK